MSQPVEDATPALGRAIVFPGQGSQAVGMGRDLAAAFSIAREVFEEVDEALKQKLSKLIFEGPSEDLTLTENTQPALLAMSVATLRVFETQGGFKIAEKAALLAGHSLGEYAALVAAGAFTLSDGAKLLRIRGAAMQQAAPAGSGGMAALLGVDTAQAQEICDEAAIMPAVNGEPPTRQIIQIANDNGGGQIVISGHKEAIDRAIEIATAKGVRRAMKLPVSAPFHCALMAPAAERMAEALSAVSIAALKLPIVANVTANKVTDPDAIPGLLVQQVTGQVRWRESVEYMEKMGIGHFIELGSGKVLTNLIKRIAPNAKTAYAGAPAEIESVLEQLA